MSLQKTDMIFKANEVSSTVVYVESGTKRIIKESKPDIIPLTKSGSFKKRRNSIVNYPQTSRSSKNAFENAVPIFEPAMPAYEAYTQ